MLKLISFWAWYKVCNIRIGCVDLLGFLWQIVMIFSFHVALMITTFLLLISMRLAWYHYSYCWGYWLTIGIFVYSVELLCNILIRFFMINRILILHPTLNSVNAWSGMCCIVSHIVHSNMSKCSHLKLKEIFLYDKSTPTKSEGSSAIASFALLASWYCTSWLSIWFFTLFVLLFHVDYIRGMRIIPMCPHAMQYKSTAASSYDQIRDITDGLIQLKR